MRNLEYALVVGLMLVSMHISALACDDRQPEAEACLNTATGSALLQTKTSPLDSPSPRTAERIADSGRNVITFARDATAATLDAAMAAAQATRQLVHRNRELEQENALLRDAAVRRHVDSNVTLNLFMAKILRTVPQHRLDNLNAIAQDIEYEGLYEEVVSFPARRPWHFNVIVATAKTFTADLIVQFNMPRPDDGSSRWDWRRSLLFASFGFLYVGITQWFFYVTVFSAICPDALAFANKPFAMKLVDKTGQEDLLIQVMVDQFIISPFVYFPIFYLLKEVLRASSKSAEDSSEGLWFQRCQRAATSYITNFKQDNLASLAVWFPADFVIFTAPMYLRMPLDHAVAFAWTMIMSYMRGSSGK